MKFRKIEDPLILGLVAGTIGNLAKMSGNLLIRFLLRKSETTYPEIAGGLFMSKKQRDRLVGRVVGGIADISLGGILGVPIVYLLRYTGKDKAAIKGLAVGHFAWMAIYGAFGRGSGKKQGVFPLDAATNLSAFINHSWYGLITAVAASKLGDPTLFPEPKSNIKVPNHEVSNQNQELRKGKKRAY